MTVERQLKYDLTYIRMARELSWLSYAIRSKVGCIIVSDDGQIISQGFNGMPKGMDNVCEYKSVISEDKCKICSIGHLCDSCENCQNIKYVTKPEVLHAESNAISKCAKWMASTEGATLYVTLSPCVDCAKLIIQAGIKRVVYDEQYRIDEGIRMLLAAGIQVDKVTRHYNSLSHVTIETLDNEKSLNEKSLKI